MIKSVRRWYRPDSVTAALELLSKKRVKPYAGGTSFQRGGNPDIHAFLDLRQLPLHEIKEQAGDIEIGALVRFSDLARYSFPDARAILSLAVSQAASNTLRNLITIGGSLADHPAWSNLLAPLLVLEARIKVAGAAQEYYPLPQFLQEKIGDGATLITGVHLPPAPGCGAYRRWARTRFDYSIVDVAVYLECRQNRIQSARLALGNLWATARRIPEIEARLTGRDLRDPELPELLKLPPVKIAPHPGFSPAFRLNLTHQLLCAVLQQIREQNHAN